MNRPVLSVREIQQSDIELIADYWMKADRHFLTGMGVALSKLPGRDEWMEMLSKQLTQPYEEKQSYCIIWQADGKPAGHSNINKIIFGKEAYMHLHLWHPGIRQRGAGFQFVKMTLPYFFTNLRLKILYCEPYALNPAPNKTLAKIGFEFIKEYSTTPGFINFEQRVNRWELTSERFLTLEKKP